MRILLISGSYPPEPCGIGDYTQRLSEALRAEGMEVQCLRQAPWRLRDSRSFFKAVDDARADIVHVQYPSIGYSRALGPQFYSCFRPCVVTIHEVSQAHPIRKLSLYGFFSTATNLIFTSAFEKKAAIRLAPWIDKKSTVIPIGSNIPVAHCQEEHTPTIIGYFGLIRSNKGLEQVLELARLSLARGGKFKILIIGSEFRGQESYYRLMRQESTGLPVEWRIGLNGPDLNAALCECGLAYLPFPDGASERRSSLLTFLNMGTPVITTRGPQVPEQLEGAVQFAANPEEAFQQAEYLMSDRHSWNLLRSRGSEYARLFRWETIAERHVQLYTQICPAASQACRR